MKPLTLLLVYVICHHYLPTHTNLLALKGLQELPSIPKAFLIENYLPSLNIKSALRLVSSYNDQSELQMN